MQTGKSGEKSSFAPEKTGVCRCEGKAVHSSGRWPLALELALSTRVLSKKADFSSAQQKALEIEIWLHVLVMPIVFQTLDTKTQQPKAEK